MGRIIFATACLVLIAFSLQAQTPDNEKKNRSIGLCYSSFGESDVFRFNGLEGEGNYAVDKFFTIGLCYIGSINKWLEFETGVDYSKYTVLITPSFIPDMSISSRKENFSIVSIPLTLRANFLKFIFVNGGVFIDVDGTKSPIDSQTGIGSLFGIGAKYDFKCGGSIFINPYFKLHALLPFSSNNNQQKLYESGVRVGLTYNLTKLRK